MPFDGTQLSPTTQALIEGRRRIEAGWIQGALRSRDGVCMAGAIDHALSDATLDLLERVVGDVTLANFNDTHTKDEVLAVYDRAIALSLHG